MSWRIDWYKADKNTPLYIKEYYEKMKDYFLSSNTQEQPIIKIISGGNWEWAYHYWIKPSLRKEGH